MTNARVMVAGYLSVDRIELPGAVHQHVPGGAALYAALGVRFAGACATLVATTGADYPHAWMKEIAALGIDISQVSASPGTSRRATLRHARSGARVSPHHRDALWWERTRALAPRTPASFEGFSAVTLGPMPAQRLVDFVSAAHGRVPVIVADTSEAFAANNLQMILALLPRLSVFAPSCEETRLMCAGQSDDEAAYSLARCGVHVLQKRGAQGALAVMAGGQSALKIEAWPGQLIDSTGAGDASVGALAAHLAQGRPFVAAAQAALKAGAKAISGIGPAGFGLQVGAGKGNEFLFEDSPTP